MHKSIRKTFYKLFGVRLANSIPEAERDICDRYGEQVIATVLAGGFAPAPAELQPIYQNADVQKRTRDWLTERADIREFRDKWVSARDLILEIVVIVLIGWELVVARRSDRMQDKNFTKQQNILQNLADSSRDTASILGALKSTTETMNQNIVTLQGPVERNAKAAEATSSTASKSLDISTRAYLSSAVVMEGTPTVGQKWRFSVSTTNTGKTAAVEVVSAVFQALATYRAPNENSVLAAVTFLVSCPV